MEDSLIIALELLYTVKRYDWTVFNPINFQIIFLADFALSKFPGNKTFQYWLLKCYDKLGLTSLLTEISKNIKGLTEKDYEHLGCIRFSHYCEFGFEKELE